MVLDSEIDILQRVLESDRNGRPTAEAARYILTLGFAADDHRRVEELAGKANEGELRPDEREELERYDRVRLMLVRLKSRARQALAAAHENAGA